MESPLTPEQTLVRRLAKERKARQQRMERSAQLRQHRVLLQHQHSLQQLQHTQTQRKQAKQEAFRLRQSSFTQRQEKRKLDYAASEAKIKQVRAVKPLHVSMEEHFHQQHDLPLRLQRDRVLGQRRGLRTPMDLPALHSHAKSFDTLIRKRDVKQKALRLIRQAEFSRRKAEAAYYRPRAAVFVEAEVRKMQSAALERSESARQRATRTHQYGRLVKELYPPRISPAKALETLKRQRSASELRIKRVGRPLDHPWRPTMRHEKRSLSTQSLPDTPKPVFDHLRARRLRHEQEFVRDLGRRSDSRWEDIWSDSSLSSPARRTEVHKAALLLDSQAKRHEAMLGRLGPHWELSVEAAESASQLYMDSIKAKLALLSDLD